MTVHALHQTAANGTTFSTLELIPTPSQPGQRHDDGNGDQPTHEETAQENNSKAKTAGPQLFLITKMRLNAGGDALAIIDRTSGDALQASLNRIPGSILLLLHCLLNRLSAL